MTVTVISYPLNEINYSFEVEATNDSAELVKYLWVDLSEAPNDEYVEITLNGITKTLLITDECRYDPVDIAFQNKEGAMQVLTFFKARKDTMTTEKESFESNRQIGKHQFVNYNINAKMKFTVNSGFVVEERNEAFKQLLLAERVWLLQGEVAVPLNVGTSSLEFKSRNNDRLINYAIEFEHAYYENNTV